jgi:drug/metabolite transporter (DMT)-like permease
MVAVDRAEAGVAATLMAMTPVFILPFAVWIEKERISPRAAIGALTAVGGVALLTLAKGSP